jgi:hypothetical protein
MMGTTVPKNDERCLRDKAINIRLIVHLAGCFIKYLKMHGTTNPKLKEEVLHRTVWSTRFRRF